MGEEPVLADHEREALTTLADCPFAQLLGIEFVTVFDNGLVLRMPVHDRLSRLAPPSVVHGGAVATLIDVTGGIAAGMGRDGAAYTTDLRVDYLAPSRGEQLIATATVRRAGITSLVVDVDVHNDGDTLSAMGRAVFAVRRAVRTAGQ